MRQESNVSVLAGLSQMGAVLDPSVLARTRALLAPHVPDRLKRKPAARRSYGPDPRHEIDFYLPADGAGRPAVLFVPGGGFVGGDKDDGAVFYRNIGNFLAAGGFVCAIMNYRLAPAHRWPAGAQDVARALAWLAEHVRDHGGDKTRMHLVAQSAGAFHAASLLFHPDLGQPPPLSSAALLSGPYQPELEPFAQNYRAYFGDDRAAAAQCGLIAHAGRTDFPVFLAAAEFDPPKLIRPSYALAEALTNANDISPRFAWFAGHNHVSPVQAVGTPFDVLGPSLVDFFAAAEGR